MTWKNALRILSGVLLLSALSLTAGADVWDDVWGGAGSGGTTIHGHSAQFNSALTSTNWSGYIAQGTGLKSAAGTWTQPEVDCTSRTTQAVSFWVGLDGVGDSYVEQIGTQVVCTKGVPTYVAFWETYPGNAAQTIPDFAVRPGDQLTASVQQKGGRYTLSIASSNGASYSQTVTNAGATGTSAEVIVERPSSCARSGCELPLPDFGSVGFSTAGLAGNDPSSVDMVKGHALATTTGTAEEFEVTWNASN